MSLTDESIMPFGKYNKRGFTMEKVPASYLLWLWEENLEEFENNKQSMWPPKLKVMEYIEDNYEILLKEHH